MAKKPKKKKANVTENAPQWTLVTATINAGDKPPDDLLVGVQIDSRPLTMQGLSGKARISPGMHTTSWGVVSLTHRPLKFGVAIVTEQGKPLLSRLDEQTGDDGLGVGADIFTA